MTLAELSDAQEAQVELLRALDSRGYDFVPVTPETHRRYLERADDPFATDLRGVFGWSQPFRERTIDRELLALMEPAGLLCPATDGWRSGARVSRILGRLFLHSPYPTTEADSVFLGPDSLRFVDFVLAALAEHGGFARLLDIGAGAGVGGISVAAEMGSGVIELAEINRKAIGYARVNALHAGVAATLIESDGLAAVEPGFDLAIANPPFMFDKDAPVYRSGGGMHGAELSLKWALDAARNVSPGGRVLLYTGSAIVGGRDRLREELEQAMPDLDCRLSWREIDPDIFGEELEKPAYRGVERIAAVGAVIEKGPLQRT